MARKPPRKTIFGIYLGDLSDAREYARQLWDGSGFGKGFFDAKYARADPWGYTNNRYDELKRAMIRYPLHGRRYTHLLDLGAGEGFVAEHLLPHVDRVSLADISAAAVERGRVRVGVPGDDLVGDALSVVRGLPDAYCDLLVISELLYYLAPFPFSRYGRALRDEVVRVLAPGGRLVLLHPYPWLHLPYRWSPQLEVVQGARLTARRSVSMLALDRR